MAMGNFKKFLVCIIAIIVFSSPLVCPRTAMVERLSSGGGSGGTICSSPTWRDKIFFMDYAAFPLYLIYTTVCWFIIVCYITEDREQSYYYLFSMMVNAIPVALIPAKHYTLWEVVKLGTGVITSFIGLVCDTAAYDQFGHLSWALSFWVLEIAAFFIVDVYGERAAAAVQILSRVTNIMSIAIMFWGFLMFPAWEYVPLEVYAAFLGAIYSLFGLMDSCNALNTVLVLVATVTRVLYALFVASNSHTKGILLWGSWALFSAGRRKFRSLREVWNSMLTWGIRILLSFKELLHRLLGLIHSPPPLLPTTATADNNLQQPPPEMELPAISTSSTAINNRRRQQQLSDGIEMTNVCA